MKICLSIKVQFLQISYSGKFLKLFHLNDEAQACNNLCRPTLRGNQTTSKI